MTPKYILGAWGTRNFLGLGKSLIGKAITNQWNNLTLITKKLNARYSLMRKRKKCVVRDSVRNANTKRFQPGRVCVCVFGNSGCIVLCQSNCFSF